MTALAILAVFWILDVACWAATCKPNEPRPLWQAWLPGSGFYYAIRAAVTQEAGQK